MTSPAADTPGNEQQANDESYPEQEAFGWVLPAIDHCREEKQGQQLTGGIVDHGRLRRRLKPSYTRSRTTPIMMPGIIIISIPCYLSTLTKVDNRCNDGI